jgi:hypothetical protein
MNQKCCRCHKLVDDPAYKSCNECRNKNSKCHRDKRISRKSQGVCPKCGKPTTNTNTVYCIECRRPAAKACKILHDSRKLNRLCVSCGTKLNVDEKYRCQKCKEIHALDVKTQSHALRIKVIDNYGSKCSCCGEAQIQLIEIDHVDNNGAEHRKQIGSHSDTLCRWIIRENYPTTIQLLCANCNQAKKKFGICPHKEKPNDGTTYSSKSWRKLRIRVIEHYGSECACCNELGWWFLELDHINNDGAARRNNGENLYDIVKTWPSDIQLLCSNCNKAKEYHFKCH